MIAPASCLQQATSANRVDAPATANGSVAAARSRRAAVDPATVARADRSAAGRRLGPLIWSGQSPSGAALQVSKDERGLWHVVYHGFRRCSSRTLELALAEATAAEPEGNWIATVEHAITARTGSSSRGPNGRPRRTAGRA